MKIFIMTDLEGISGISRKEQACGGGAQSLGLGRRFGEVFHHMSLAFCWPQLSVQSDLVLAVLADPAVVGWWGPAFGEQQLPVKARCGAPRGEACEQAWDSTPY